MKINTFWNIFIKIIGMYILMNFITNYIPTLVFYFSNYTSDGSFVLNTIKMSAFLGIVFLIFWMIFFKTHSIIDKLQLEKGIEESRIDLFTNTIGIIQISMIVLGGVLIIDNLPDFIRELFLFNTQEEVFTKYNNSPTLLSIFIKTLLGFVLIIFNKYVASKFENFFEK